MSLANSQARPPTTPPTINSRDLLIGRNLIVKGSIVGETDLDIVDLTVTGTVTVPPPVNDTDATTKQYVDDLIFAIKWKQPVRVTTTGANIALTGIQTIDGILLTDGDRILVKDQTTPSENGIYLVSTSTWSRSLDLDTGSSASSIATIIEEGAIAQDTQYICTNNQGSDVVGTDALVFVQFSAGGSGITNLNGETGATQSFATGGAGTDFGIVSAGNVHTFNIPDSNVTNRGLLTAADWSTFNNKVGSGGASTDNALPRWDGVGGTTLQDSGVVVDDSDNVTGVADLTATGFLRSNTSLVLEDPGAGSNTMTIQSGTIGASFTLTFPDDDGTSGQILRTDGTGTLSWVDATSINAAGADTQIQFNDSNNFGASANLTFNTGTNTLNTTNIQATGIIQGASVTDGTATLNAGNLTFLTQLQFNNGGVQSVISRAAGGATHSLVLPNTQGAASTFLQNDGAGNLSWATPGGGGDVSGPGAATDNAVVRWNGATGTVVQDSGVIIDDTDNITGVVALTATGTITGATLTDGTLSSTAGAVTGATSITASGTVTGGTLTDGTLSSTAGAVTGATSIQLNNAGTTTSVSRAPGGASHGLVLPNSQGAASTFLQNDGAGNLSWATPGGGGDVSGPGAATDNAVVRWNGATGTVVQDSGVIIDDTDNITGVVALTATGTVTGGTLTDGTLSSTAGAVTGATSITASGTVTGGTLTDGTLSSTAGAVTGATTIAAGTSVTTPSVVVDNAGTTTSVSRAAGGVSHGLVLPNSQGAASTFLQNDGAGNLSWATPGGGGDVSGPGAATDNAVVRWNGATGTVVQDSNVIIDDTDNITGVVALTASGTITGGTLTDGTLSSTAGAVTGATSITASGTITGGTLTDGTLSSTAGAVTGVTTLDATGNITTTRFVVDDGSGNITALDRVAGGTDVVLELPNNTGSNGQVLTTNGVFPITTLSWTTPNNGDVVGPGAATDNALVRWDGVTGALVQNSGITIDDSNDVTGVRNLSCTGNGQITTDGSLILQDPGAGSNTVTLQSPDPVTTSYSITLPPAQGSTGQGLINSDGAGTLLWQDVGDVSGPGAAVTDNAIVRWDGVGGTTVQNSSVTINDSGAINANSITAITGEFTSGLSVQEIAGSDTFTLQANSLTASYVFLVPTDGGTLNQVLTSNGGGLITQAVWQDRAAGSNEGEIQYRASDGNLEVDTLLGWNTTNNVLSVGIAPASSSTNTRVHVRGTAGGSVPALNAANVALFQNNDIAARECYITIMSGNTGNSGIFFGDTDSSTSGFIQYDHGDEELNISTGGSIGLTVSGDNASIRDYMFQRSQWSSFSGAGPFNPTVAQFINGVMLCNVGAIITMNTPTAANLLAEIANVSASGTIANPNGPSFLFYIIVSGGGQISLSPGLNVSVTNGTVNSGNTGIFIATAYSATQVSITRIMTTTT